MRFQHLTIASVAVLLAGCSSNSGDYIGPEPEKPELVEKEYNTFNFSTENSQSYVNLSYNADVKTSIYFELFDEEPGEWADNGKYYKKEGVLPIYSGFTDENGQFKSNISLPSYVSKLYAYTPYFIATPILETTMTGNTATFDDNKKYSARALTRAAMTGVTNKSYMVCPVEEIPSNLPSYATEKRWYDSEVDYDNNGRLQKFFQGTAELPLISQDKLDYYLKTHVAVFPVDRTAYPEKYIQQADIELTKSAEVAVTIIGGNTCWNSSMGYYYYPKDQAPTKLEDMNVILIFPNTQNGTYAGSKDYIGAANGDCVQLLYYPNIASGSKEGATTTFPANYKIGFVLAANAWSGRMPNWQQDRKQRSATSSNMSKDYLGKAYSKPMSAVYNIDGQVLVSFEDDNKYDHNYSDLIMTFQTNPVDATIPTPDPDFSKIKSEVNVGFYAFEDQWPSKGDYDMNDVIFNAKRSKVYLASNGAIYEEGYTFKTYTNAAKAEKLKSGIAVRLEGVTTKDTLEFFTRKPGEEEFKPATFEFDSKNKIVYLTDNAKQDIGTEYMFNVKHDTKSTLSSTEAIKAKPFIYRDVDDKRLEIHIAQEAPTNVADKSFFGTEDDASQPDKNIFYVRSGNYPFGIFLAGALESDMSKLFDAENETIAIDGDEEHPIYPKYKSWVESNGKKDKDWYK